MANPVTNEMLKAAMKKAIEIGLIPRHSHLDGYLKSWESLGLVIQAALEATPYNR
ncbi:MULTISPECIES: hypothetical protein [unclassified Pseudomonas]|uniref:hypothetical protein n=1 Tax=unclassified Pseudomonas TaxID=196821 RepID=UPI001913DE5A|nr:MULTISPECIES: hypothetical protein [unclassified Pseudomonas]MBK5550199.1 hypothetical protein [Pseudomonas sp. TH03]MEB0227221.1 hypothetical protein [Pseudomonas sp. 5S1]MEB0295875.1 hypothetical protein [Pseudomonas sp. 10S4]WPX20455.1 hypothetical protein RHM58_11405 [Pseudomonas sp. 10S4]